MDAKTLSAIVSPIIGQYLRETRAAIAELTTRIASLEAENEHLRAKMQLRSEHQRRRPMPTTTQRIALLERQMDKADDAAD
jgi:hypothetical protein